MIVFCDSNCNQEEAIRNMSGAAHYSQMMPLWSQILLVQDVC
ncbi:MAG: hypothetical protein ACLSGK_06845 [Lachnospiraceae bacterium]